MSLRKILYGLEYVFDGLICDHVVITGFDKTKTEGALFNFYVRKWHPSYWCGYVRCRWLGDKCGSAYYT
jgi:hypothetical protein